MYKITVVADLHHFSETLSDGGRAYELRSSSDQKCLAETGAIIDSAFEKIGNSDCDAVLIAGDLSDDGEKVSHEEIREKIIKLKEKKPVYVVYATHDWCCDGNAKRFVGDKFYNDVETMSPPELREFYHDFGIDKSYSEFVTHLGSSSYAAKLGKDILFLGINDDQDGKGHAGYKDDHFTWIINQIEEAKQKGMTVILMEHHLVIPNISLLLNKGMLIGDYEERAEVLAAAGADIVIVGHSHTQRTTLYTAKNGNVMTQVNVGSLCGYPSPITTITVDKDEYRIDVDHLEKFIYHGKEYTSQYIKEHTEGVLLNILKSAVNDKEDFLERMEGPGLKSNALEESYPVISKVASFAMNVTVGKAGKIINALTFGKGVRKDAVEKIKDDNLLDHIMDIFLSVFDGSIKKYRVTDPVYIVVRDVARLPKRIAKTLKIKALQTEKMQKIFSQIIEIAEELTNPSRPDNQHCVIKRHE